MNASRVASAGDRDVFEIDLDSKDPVASVIGDVIAVTVVVSSRDEVTDTAIPNASLVRLTIKGPFLPDNDENCLLSLLDCVGPGRDDPLSTRYCCSGFGRGLGRRRFAAIVVVAG